MNNSIKVGMVGLGYIGLPTAALMALKNLKVLGIDIKKEVVDTINRGEIHIVEPELDTLVDKVVKSGNLRASQKPEQADVIGFLVGHKEFKNLNIPSPKIILDFVNIAN